MGRKHVILPSWSPRASSEKSEARQPSDSPDMRRCARPDEGRCAWVIIPAAVERERERENPHTTHARAGSRVCRSRGSFPRPTCTVLHVVQILQLQGQGGEVEIFLPAKTHTPVT